MDSSPEVGPDWPKHVGKAFGTVFCILYFTAIYAGCAVIHSVCTITVMFFLLQAFTTLSCDRSTASFQSQFQGIKSGASCFKFQYLLSSVRSSNSCSRLLLCLLFTPIFPGITRSRSQFLCKMWPILLAILRFFPHPTSHCLIILSVRKPPCFMHF